MSGKNIAPDVQSEAKELESNRPVHSSTNGHSASSAAAVGNSRHLTLTQAQYDRLRRLWQEDDARQARAAEAKACRLFTLEDGLRRQYPPWEIDGIVRQGSHLFLYGQTSVGKTYVAVDIVMAKVTGVTFQGKVLRPGPVVYIAAEDSISVIHRARAWLTHHERSLAHPLHFWDQPISFFNRKEVEEFLNELRTLPQRPSMIVLDNLARCFAGGDENQTKDMQTVCANIQWLQRETGCTFITIHHKDKQGRNYRGSGVILDQADAATEVSNADGLISLTCQKQRQGPPFEEMQFSLQPVGNGDFCVLVPSEFKREQLTERQQKVIDTLAPVKSLRLGELEKQTGIPRNSLNADLKTLTERGIIFKQGKSPRTQYLLSNDSLHLSSQAQALAATAKEILLEDGPVSNHEPSTEPKQSVQ